jgi:hypothetical protein
VIDPIIRFITVLQTGPYSQSIVYAMSELSFVSLQLVRQLAYLLSGQGQYDEALKLGKEVRSKLELAFTFEASDRLSELEKIMKEYVTVCTCMHMVDLYSMSSPAVSMRREQRR